MKLKKNDEICIINHITNGIKGDGKKPPRLMPNVGLQESTNNMKKIFRKTIGYMVVGPFVVASKFLSIFLGQEKAIEVVGARLTESAKRSFSFQSPETIKKLLNTFGVEKILFASDWPYGSRKTAFRALRKACKGDEHIERRTFYENAAELLNMPE